jgi:hypothetical protein
MFRGGTKSRELLNEAAANCINDEVQTSIEKESNQVADGGIKGARETSERINNRRDEMRNEYLEILELKAVRSKAKDDKESKMAARIAEEKRRAEAQAAMEAEKKAEEEKLAKEVSEFENATGEFKKMMFKSMINDDELGFGMTQAQLLKRKDDKLAAAIKGGEAKDSAGLRTSGK